MNKFFKTFAAMMMLAGILMLNVACEGPEGPEGADGINGKDGANGTDGKDGNATCGVCHSENATDVNLKFAQYDLSQHNQGIVYEEEAGRIACGGCHSGDGFAEAARLGQDDAKTVATSKINCKACHYVHKDYAASDWGLRISSGFALRVNKANIDLGKGNLCAKCHQARVITRSTPDTVKAASSTASYSRIGPHYGTPTNVFVMQGLYEIAGASTPLPTTNPHGNTPNGCVTCHMGSDATNPAVGGHSFSMPVASLAKIVACQTCHTSAEMSDGSLTKQIAADIATYRRKLIDKGWLDTTQAFDHEGNYMVLGEYASTPGGKARTDLSKSDIDVLINYLYIAKDRSKGVHNPPYIKAVIAQGLEYLNK